MTYFSDRELGPKPRRLEDIGPSLWGGLVALVESRIDDGSFGYRYPETCNDAPATPVGTDRYRLGLAVAAEIPALADVDGSVEVGWGTDRNRSAWPLNPQRLPVTLAVLDLLEFCYMSVGLPILGDYHDYFRHTHIRSFDRERGARDFRESVNRLFARNGVAYEIAADGRVMRLGTPLLTDNLRRAGFSIGDAELDGLLERAQAKYLSADSAIRRESLEQLWDAFERAKTLRHQNKKTGIALLIDEVTATPEMAEQLDVEAAALTTIGNRFRIRHHETGTVDIADTEIDYLFHRAFALIAQLLGLHPNTRIFAIPWG